MSELDLLDFSYGHLEADNNSIRVLCIEPEGEDTILRCSLRHQKLSDSYTCLSYTWGTEKEIKNIILNNCLFPARPSLRSFLTAARRYGFNGPFWIDAVCINQSDNIEKNAQVKMMGQIYQQAKEVIVWLDLPSHMAQSLHDLEAVLVHAAQSFRLEDWQQSYDNLMRLHGWGRRDEESKQTRLQELERGNQVWIAVFEVVYDQLGWANLDVQSRLQLTFKLETDRIQNLVSSAHPIWKSYRDTVLAMVQLASADYWQRSWIVQEIILAREVKVMSPAGPFRLDAVLCFTTHWLRQEQDANLRSPDKDDVVRPLIIRLLNTLQHFELLFYPRLSEDSTSIVRSLNNHFQGLTRAVNMTMKLGCTQARDRIYSVLSLVPRGHEFDIDYACEYLALLWEVVLFDMQSDTANSKAANSPQSGDAQLISHLQKYTTLLACTFEALHMTRPGLCEVVALANIPSDIVHHSPKSALSWALLDYGRTEYEPLDIIYGQFNVLSEMFLVIWPVVPDDYQTYPIPQPYPCSVWQLRGSGWQHVKWHSDFHATTYAEWFHTDCSCCLCNIVQRATDNTPLLYLPGKP